MHHPHGCGPAGHRFGGRRGFGGPGGGGFGGFGRGFGGPGGGGFGNFGRMFRDGGLRLVALALLEESPRHGYDIIKAVEERTGGAYSPSPGVVYPTLTYLEEAGYAQSEAEGNKKVYTITEAGKAYLNENRQTSDSILHAMSLFGNKASEMREMFGWMEFGPGGHEPGDEDSAQSELHRARRRLRALIVAALEGTEDDRRRVAEILRRAGDEILGKTGGP